MNRIKAALFIDFDNVYLSLLNDYSESAARRFANPSRWMPWIESGAYVTDREDLMGERSVLIRRCYGSPERMRPFRAYFVRSGFQVVDCPPLTTSGKNSADIVMTLDIADAIEHRTRFDEFVILSSDADFTPVALRLRAYDRITSILANQQTAAAFRSCCDVVIDMEDFEPVVGDGTERVAAAGVPVPEPQDPARPLTDADGGFDAIRAEIRTAIDEELATASEPVVIGSLAMRIQQRWPVVRESDWLGTGGFKNFLREVVDGNARLSLTPPGFVYDVRRHKPPNHLGELTEPMRDLVERLYVVVGFPRLHPRQYQALFKALAEQSGQRKTVTEITRSARDRVIENGTPIARQPFGFVTKALFFQGCAIADSEVGAEEIARLFRTNVQERARGAQLDLEGDDVRLLNELLGVSPEPQG